MQIITFVGLIILSYFLGSIPFGLIMVRVFSGKDIRKVQSGRTGGTNAMRAAGFWVGLATAILDGLKGATSVWIAQAVYPEAVWLKVLAPLAVIIGHNYSIFLMERNEKGKLRLRGGAGGAPCVGGSIGLWAPSGLIIVPMGAVIVLGVGYASLATMSVALLSSIIFAYKALTGSAPWEFILYGVFAELLLIWSLKPNIRRLLNGTERVVGLRVWLSKSKAPS